MTPEEEKEILKKRAEHLEMLITAAKNRGDISTAKQLIQELEEVNIKLNE